MAGWLDTAADELGVDALTREEIDSLLDLTRDVAHGTERRYAPLTSFLAGLAIGRGEGDRGQQLSEVVATLRAVLPEQQD